MIDLVSSLMAIMLLVSHITSSYPSCPDDCHCYQDTGMLTANCTSLPLASENIEILNLIPKQKGQIIELREGQFTGFKKLKYLNLSNCSIRYVHKQSFFGVTDLIEIDLSFNRIQSLDSAVFQHIKNLTTVILRGNNFNFVSDDPFLISDSIEHLDIGECGISHLHPGTFYGTKRVKYILLDNNKLQHLKYNSLPKFLVYLNLANNLIINVPTDLLVSLKQLKKLDLSGNPINCTCQLMNLQDHLSGLGVIFENKVICASPQKYAGVSWNLVNENELCIEETLFDENMPIKYPRDQEKYKYQINHKKQTFELEDNYFETNIQSDQPLDGQFEKNPNSEILFQNDDTKAMGPMMHQDENENANHDLTESDFVNHEPNRDNNTEDFENHFLPPKINLPDEKEKEKAFDIMDGDSDQKVDSKNILESFKEEIVNTEVSTTQIVSDLDDQDDINGQSEEQDAANVADESITESDHSDNIKKNIEKNGAQDAVTEKTELIKKSNLEETTHNDNQIIAVENLDDSTTEISAKEAKENIVTIVKNSETNENKKEIETNEPVEHQSEQNEIEVTTDINLEVKTETNFKELGESETKNWFLEGKLEERKSEEQLGPMKLETTNEKADENEEFFEKVTTQNSINEDIEIFKPETLLGTHIDEKLEQIKEEKSAEEIISNQNLVGEIVEQNDTVSTVIPLNIEINTESEGESSRLEEGDKIIESKDIENENKDVLILRDSEGTTEDIIENHVTVEVDQLERQTDLPNVEEKNNVETVVNEEHLTNLENEPYRETTITTDSVDLTTLEIVNEKIDFQDKSQNFEEVTNSLIDVIETTTNTTVDIKNETVNEETKTLLAVDVLDQETTPSPIFESSGNETIEATTAYIYLDSNDSITANQDNISDVSKTDQSVLEISPDIHINTETLESENTSAILGNIKQSKDVTNLNEDDGLIGDKSLKETVPIEFESAHVVLGSIVVLILVLVLFGLYKCTTEVKEPKRNAKDVESNHGTEMQDMASLLPKPNSEEPKIISKKYPDEASPTETVSLIQEEQKDTPTETESTVEKENSLNNNTQLQNKPTDQSTPLKINPSAPIQRTRVKVGIIPDSIPRTPIFVQKSYNNGVTNS